MLYCSTLIVTVRDPHKKGSSTISLRSCNPNFSMDQPILGILFFSSQICPFLFKRPPNSLNKSVFFNMFQKKLSKLVWQVKYKSCKSFCEKRAPSILLVGYKFNNKKKFKLNLVLLNLAMKYLKIGGNNVSKA